MSLPRVSRRHRTRTTGTNLFYIDVESPIPVDDDPSCIDLTADDESVAEVNSANNDDSLIVIEHMSRAQRQRNRERSARRHARPYNLPVQLSPNVRETQATSAQKNTKAKEDEPSTSTADVDASMSYGYAIQCPICFDSLNTILKSNKQLVSTICGHIFCSQCLKESMQNQKMCPTCRKKLTAKQFHPLFLA